jgi:penicillin amidase
VVDGTLTASGRPLLANDPHLGTRLPSIWYLAHLAAGDFDVIGATLPGTPAVALGRNRFIAWGATNVAADVEDLYREKVDPTGRFAEFRGGQEPLQMVSETIVVKGAEPIHLEVRVSRHGPLVSDAINTNNALLRRNAAPLEPLAFRWTALDADDTTLPSFLRLNDARNWEQFTAALRAFVVPAQNFVYADMNGHIGYYAPGRIPIRARGDGSRPADGWSGDAEWTGWIPFDELPHAYDPPEHFIVTANNRPAPASYPHLLGLEWPEPYRAQRIADLLRGRKNLTPDDFATMQADTVSLHARALLPLLLSHAHPQSAADSQALTIARGWNDDARADSAATAIFEAWFLRLAPTIAGDDLGPIILDYQSRFTYITRFVVATLGAADSPWCDDVRTEKRETCDDAVSTALHEAVVQLTRQLGGDMARWRWDGVHRAVFPHQGLDAVAALRPLLSRSVPGAGDWSTIDVGPIATDHGFEQRSVPSYREIIDLSPRNDSRFLDAIGESGHPLSKHYDDFLADWRTVRHRPMRTEREAIEQGALGHLRLQRSQQ